LVCEEFGIESYLPGCKTISQHKKGILLFFGRPTGLKHTTAKNEIKLIFEYPATYTCPSGKNKLVQKTIYLYLI
jgi:hypothetical protein